MAYCSRGRSGRRETDGSTMHTTPIKQKHLECHCYMSRPLLATSVPTSSPRGSPETTKGQRRPWWQDSIGGGDHGVCCCTSPFSRHRTHALLSTIVHAFFQVERSLGYSQGLEGRPTERARPSFQLRGHATALVRIANPSHPIPSQPIRYLDGKSNLYSDTIHGRAWFMQGHARYGS